MGLAEWAIGGLAWEALSRAVRHGSGAIAGAQPASHWIPRLNDALGAEVRVHAAVNHEPTLVIDGSYVPSDAVRVRAEQLRPSLAQQSLNEPHALLVAEPLWAADPVCMHAVVTDYATVLALRESGASARVLSSSVLLVCRETRQLVLHHRATESETFGGLLHTLGGAFQPPVAHGASPDRGGLRSTAVREVFEESQLVISPDERPGMMLSEELGTAGFIQLVLLGVGVSRVALTSVCRNWEGDIVLVDFDKLPQLLGQSGWVPSGRCHVLAWLAMGAPGAGLAPKFDGLSAHRLFDLALGA